MTAIRETCACGASIRIKHPDPAPIAQEWRSSHPCDRGGPEQARTAPHCADSELGFHRADDTEPLPMPPATRRDLREVR